MYCSGGSLLLSTTRRDYFIWLKHVGFTVKRSVFVDSQKIGTGLNFSSYLLGAQVLEQNIDCVFNIGIFIVPYVTFVWRNVTSVLLTRVYIYSVIGSTISPEKTIVILDVSNKIIMRVPDLPMWVMNTVHVPDSPM